jgi:hypothetical protein
MRDHAVISPHFWTGDTGRELRKDPDAQRIAFYLMTCPSANMIGLYYLPIPLICHEVGISKEGAMKGLARLSEGGFCAYDAPSEVVFVKQMARYQVGEVVHPGDKRLLGVQRMLLQMKNSCFYNEFLERYAEIFHLTLAPNGSPSIAPSKGHGSSYKDQEQDKEKEKEKTPPSSLRSDVPPQQVMTIERPVKPKRGRRGMLTHFLPEDFVVTPALRTWATEHAPQVDVEAETINMHEWEYKDPHSDWDRAWKTWMRRAQKDIVEGRGFRRVSNGRQPGAASATEEFMKS